MLKGIPTYLHRYPTIACIPGLGRGRRVCYTMEKPEYRGWVEKNVPVFLIMSSVNRGTPSGIELCVTCMAREIWELSSHSPEVDCGSADSSWENCQRGPLKLPEIVQQKLRNRLFCPGNGLVKSLSKFLLETICIGEIFHLLFIILMLVANV